MNTPFERPGELSGKVEFGDEELAAVLEERARRNVERAPTIGGETGAGPTHWYEFWNAKSTRTSKIINQPDGRVPPLTAAARTRAAAQAEALKGRGPSDSWTDRSLGDRCIVSRGGWPHVIVNAGSYGNSVRIVQSPGFVVITQMIHETRIIPVDGRPHVSQGIRQYLGDSRGHWEGDTLVVEVTNFSDKTDFRGSRERRCVSSSASRASTPIRSTTPSPSTILRRSRSRGRLASLCRATTSRLRFSNTPVTRETTR